MSILMITIREEEPQDIEAVAQVNLQAFGQLTEAGIVDSLRKNCPGLLSLVALQEEQVVGHILFSPVEIEGEEKSVQGMGLGPVAVLPALQRQGIGSMLIARGLHILGGQCCAFVIVLGHPEYYPRFGFEPASLHGICSQWAGVPDEAFMILTLDRAAMADASGVARYQKEFDDAV
jgi:putative acetyltransferase